jgi:hypothetical protein
MSTPKGSQAYLPIIAVILGEVGDIGDFKLFVSTTQQVINETYSTVHTKGIN